MMAKLNGLFRALAPADAPTAPDAELLARFVSDRCEAAFAELARRYGPMVLAACRRVCGDAHLAEDALQAAFVVFAAKASTVKPASALPAWLHSVATRTALRARTVAHRRSRRETPVEVLPERATGEPSAADGADLARAVDEEIAKLPEALRVAVVLCELQGVSRKDAAARMGVPEGTVSSRLAAARKALAERLKNRGLAPSAAALSAALGASAPASVPPSLMARALAALAPDTLPAAVAALSSGVLRTMLLNKLKLAGLLVALALGVAAGVALAVPPSAPKPDATAPFLVRADEPKGAPKALPKGPNKMLFWNDGKLVLADPDGKNQKEFSVKKPENRYHPSGGRLSPDGTTIAVTVPEVTLNAGGGEQRAKATVFVRKVGEEGEGTNLGIESEIVAWSPDGTELVCTTVVQDKRDAEPEMKSVIVNVNTKAQTALKLPSNHVVTDWTRDGKFVTTSLSLKGAGPNARLHLMNRDGSEHKALAKDTNAMFARVSPDGTKALCVLLTFPKETPEEKKKREDAGARFPSPKHELALLDLATGKLANVQEVPLNAELGECFCWSPDGKQIAYTWREKHEGKPEDLINKETESHLIVCDPDGKNAKTVLSAKGRGQWHVMLGGVDWR